MKLTTDALITACLKRGTAKSHKPNRIRRVGTGLAIKARKPDWKRVILYEGACEMKRTRLVRTLFTLTMVMLASCGRFGANQ